MDADHSFQLEPISPEDRAFRLEKKRKTTREVMARARAEARAEGVNPTTFFIAHDHIATLDALKELRGFRNRSQAFAFVMATFASDPKMTKKLGL